MKVKAEKPSSTATGVSGKAVELANPVYVATGSKAMDEGLDFGGKTFTMAITEETQYHSPQFARMIAAFQKKYNCKIKTVELAFGSNYVAGMTQAKSAGNPYDIVFVHGSLFPNVPDSDLICDLTPYMTTADYDTGKGGIDIAKSSYFAIGNNLYGVCNTSSVFPCVIYYNKALFAKAGLEDPMELYNANKWTWNKFVEMGRKVTDTANNVYFGDRLFYQKHIVYSYGVPANTYKNGKYVTNLDDPNFQKGLTLIQRLASGYGICTPPSSNAQRFADFYAGKAYCTVEESSKFSELSPNVETSSAFNNSISNLGVVPIPQDAASAKRGYPSGWYTAICAGTGSKDPRVAVAFAKFQSTYEDVKNDKYELNQTQQALVDKLISGNLAAPHMVITSTGDDTTATINSYIEDLVCRGYDIAQTIETYKGKIISLLKESKYY